MNKKRSVLLVAFYIACFTSFAQVMDSFDPPQQDSVQSIFESVHKNKSTSISFIKRRSWDSPKILTYSIENHIMIQ